MAGLPGFLRNVVGHWRDLVGSPMRPPHHQEFYPLTGLKRENGPFSIHNVIIHAAVKPITSNREPSMPAQAIPEGYHTVTPYLIINGAAAAIDFYKIAFQAVELFRMPGPDGRIGHAEIKIGNSPVMLADEHPEMGYRSPTSLGGAGVSLMIYVENVDTVFPQAIAAGGKELRPLANQFYGDRSGTLQDPFGHVWTVSTHVEDVPPDELQRRSEAVSQGEA